MCERACVRVDERVGDGVRECVRERVFEGVRTCVRGYAQRLIRGHLRCCSSEYLGRTRHVWSTGRLG